MKKKELNYLKKTLIQQLMELLRRSDCSLDGMEEVDDNLSDLLDRLFELMTRQHP